MHVQDGRKRGWFWVHDSIFDEWGETLGAVVLSVYLCLCRHADKEGNCYPSLATIAKKCGISRRSAINAVAKLEGYALIEKTKRTASQGDPDTNILTVMDPCNEKALAARGSEHGALGVVNVVHQGSERGALPLVNVVHYPGERGAPPLEGLPQKDDHLRTTTTTTGIAEKIAAGDGGKCDGGSGSSDGDLKKTKQAGRQSSRQLAYPQGMADDEMKRAATMLEGHQNAQEMLDAVEAARRAGQIKKSALALLMALIRRDKAGSFDPSPGYEIAKERKRGRTVKNGGVRKEVELSNLRAEVRALEALADKAGGDSIDKQLVAAKARLAATLRPC